MAITYVGAGTLTSQTVAATTIAVNFPTGLATNDYLIFALTNNVTGPPTTPAGWTAIVNVAASGTTTPNLSIYGRFGSASDSGGSVTVTKASGTANSFCMAFRGVDLTTPVDTTPSTLSSAASLNFNIPAFTTVSANDALVCFASANGGGTWTPPTNFAFNETLDTAAATPGLTADYFLSSLAAATTTGVFNYVRSSSIRGAAVALGLRPAVAAATPPILVMPPRAA